MALLRCRDGDIVVSSQFIKECITLDNMLTDIGYTDISDPIPLPATISRETIILMTTPNIIYTEYTPFLISILTAANFLAHDTLVRGVIQRIATIIKENTASNLRTIFNLPDDLTTTQKETLEQELLLIGSTQNPRELDALQDYIRDTPVFFN